MQQNRVMAAAAVLLGSLVGPSSVQAQDGLTDFVKDALACALTETLIAEMPVNPLHELSATGECVTISPEQADGRYYRDAECRHAVDFEPSSIEQYCDAALDKETLGEGRDIVNGTWTLSPGSRIDIGARSLEGVQWPYLQRRIYRRVDTPRGECALEMRVYAPEPGASDSPRPSMLAFHGGSWSARGFGFFGLELSIPHYVDQGFVVYAPFYRLLGDREGSVACNQSEVGAILDDASAALAWVREHAAEYGSSNTPVVFGQSAGAHLAASLAVDDPQSVSAAILLYAPVDFADFVVRAQQGYYTDSQGLDIMKRVLGTDAMQADVSASPVPENSLPQRIVESDLKLPPVFMIHGLQDTLVEARQSVRLCDALAGRELLDTATDTVSSDALRTVQSCGMSSNLHLITQGQHALDICLLDTTPSTDLCRSGSEDSREEVSMALGQAVSFAKTHAPIDDRDSSDTDTGGRKRSGGGTLNWVFLLTLASTMALRQRLVL